MTAFLQFFVHRIQNIFWMATPFLFLNFVYKHTQKQTDIIYYILTFLVITSAFLGVFTNYIMADFVIGDTWIDDAQNGPLYTPVLFLTILFPAIYSIFIILRKWLSTKDAILHKQLTTLLIGMLLTLISVVSINVLLLVVLKISTNPPLGSSFMLIQTISVTIGIRRYNLLSVTVHQAAAELFSSLHDGVILFDKYKNIVEINSPARKFLEIDGIPKEDLKLEKIFPDEYDFEKNYESHEMQLKTSQGSHYFLISQNPLYKRSHYTGKLAILKDITDRKKSENDLLYAKNEAEQANRAKSDFLTNISHEIRTPLNGIIGFAELITEDATNPKSKHEADLIINESEKLMELINNVLDISKIESGKYSISYHVFSLHDSFKYLRKIFTPQAEKKDIYLDFYVDNELPDYLIGDSMRVRQVLINLIGNAIKFTQEGGVKIKLIIEDEIPNGVSIRFEVKDTGIGIPQERQAVIFNSFEQADPSTTRQYGGSGLGTTISKMLVELMGGTIGVFSIEGKGSTFWFTLPFIISTQPEHTAHLGNHEYKPLKQSDLFHKRILLVEDYEVNQEIILRHLNDLGITTILAHNGREALQWFEKEEFDLILMDIQMPQMDGYTATRHIRQQPRGYEIPIVGITANAFEKDKNNCFNAGMNDVIIKPIRKESFLKTIKFWLSKELLKKEPADEQPPEDELFQDDGTVLLNYEGFINDVGDPEIANQIIKGFLDLIPRQLEIMKQALEDNDFPLLHREAHSIKGGALNVMAYDLSEKAKDIELQAKEKQKDQLENKIDILEKTYRKLTVHLKKCKILD